MQPVKIQVQTLGEGFYSITDQVKDQLSSLVQHQNQSGVLFLFIMHTSCALLLTESYDHSAQLDMENFLKYLVPRSLSFVEHTLEGPDDSPSHMKSLLLHQHLAILVENGKLVLGRWQGIFLAEFRDASKQRSVILKFLPG